jgi:hypothetical protein
MAKIAGLPLEQAAQAVQFSEMAWYFFLPGLLY